MRCIRLRMILLLVLVAPAAGAQDELAPWPEAFFLPASPLATDAAPAAPLVQATPIAPVPAAADALRVEPDPVYLSRENPCSAWAPPQEEMIDATRRQLHRTLCGATLWLDGLFGDRMNVDAARAVHGRLEVSVTDSGFYGMDERVRLNVQFDLPNLEERASAFLGRDDQDDFVRDRAEGLALRSQFPSLGDRDEWLAGLGYSLPSNRRFNADVRVGVRGTRNLRAFAQSRLRYNLYSDTRNLVHLRLTPFWNTRDGFGITPGADYTYVLTPRQLLRWSNIGTRSERSEGFDWRSALIYYLGLGGLRGIALEGFIRGATEDTVPLREYGSRLIYRQPLLRQRLFAELVGGYTWPREDPEEPREGAYLVGLGLELPFGKAGP